MRILLVFLVMVACGETRFPMHDVPAPASFTAKLCKPQQVHTCSNQTGGLCSHPGGVDADCLICDGVSAPCWEEPNSMVLKPGQEFVPGHLRLCVRQCSECELHMRGADTVCR